MSDEVRNALLVFAGGVLVLIVLDGTYTHYVRPGAGPLVLAAGLVIVGLALVDVVRDLRGLPDPLDGPMVDTVGDASVPHESHGHGRTAWLLLAPVLVVLLVAPPPLGSDAALLAGDRTAPVPASTTDDPLPPGDAPALAVVDFVSRSSAAPDGPLTGRDVTLTGFLTPSRPGGAVGVAGGSGAAPGPSTAPGPSAAPGTDLARLVISCCAADASPVRVHLDGLPSIGPAAALGAGAEGRPDRWVQVRGRLVPGTATVASGHVPTLRVLAVEPVPAPDPAYEY